MSFKHRHKTRPSPNARASSNNARRHMVAACGCGTWHSAEDDERDCDGAGRNERYLDQAAARDLRLGDRLPRLFINASHRSYRGRAGRAWPRRPAIGPGLSKCSGPTESPEWRRGTAVLWPSVRIASSGRSQGPRCSTRAKTEATGSGEMVGQQNVATAEATRTMCPPGDLQRGESSR